MSTLPVNTFEPLAVKVRFDEDSMIVDLADGRVISVPLVFPDFSMRRPNNVLITNSSGAAKASTGNLSMRTCRSRDSFAEITELQYKPVWNADASPIPHPAA